MNLFFRIFQHLLPTGIALRIVQAAETWYLDDQKRLDAGLSLDSAVGGRDIDRLFAGLSEPFADAKTYDDATFLDLLPEYTTKLAMHEDQFGLIQAALTADRRANVAAAWQATGGQSPRYIQDVIWAAGFTDVYLHEWWDVGSPLDPRTVTNYPAIGTMQAGEPLAQAGEPTALANDFLANEPLYFVNNAQSVHAPPIISSDSTLWPCFAYVAAQTFPTHAEVPASRRAEFEKLLLSLIPYEQWIVALVDYV